MTHWTEHLFVENPGLFQPNLETRVADADDDATDILALLADEYDRTPDTALDAGCGIGRHVVALARQGVDATGIDVAAPYLDRARDLAADAGVADRTAFREHDVRELDRLDGSFDLVTSLYTSFGYFDADTNRAVLAAARDRLAPDGALVLETVDKDGLLADFRPAGVNVHDDTRYVEQREYRPRDSRVHTTVRVYDADTDDYRGSWTMNVRVYSPRELRRLLERVGFDTVDVYAGFDGEEPTRESMRQVAVALK